MATKKSTRRLVPVTTSDVPKTTIDAWKAIEKGLNDEQERTWRAQAICRLALAAARQCEYAEPGDVEDVKTHGCNIRLALQEVDELPGAVASHLDDAVILAPVREVRS